MPLIKVHHVDRDTRHTLSIRRPISRGSVSSSARAAASSTLTSAHDEEASRLVVCGRPPRPRHTDSVQTPSSRAGSSLSSSCSRCKVATHALLRPGNVPRPSLHAVRPDRPSVRRAVLDGEPRLRRRQRERVRGGLSRERTVRQAHERRLRRIGAVLQQRVQHPPAVPTSPTSTACARTASSEKKVLRHVRATSVPFALLPPTRRERFTVVGSHGFEKPEFVGCPHSPRTALLPKASESLARWFGAAPPPIGGTCLSLTVSPACQSYGSFASVRSAVSDKLLLMSVTCLSHLGETAIGNQSDAHRLTLSVT
jgi:hypothetical protein